MKVYAIIITIVTILALGVVGYGVWAGQKISANIVSLENQNKKATDDLKRVQQEYSDSTQEIKNLSQLLRETSSSFIHPGNYSVISFNAVTMEKIDQQIAQIKNAYIKKDVQQKWSAFQDSMLLNDYRGVIATITDNISNLAVEPAPSQSPSLQPQK